MIDLKLLIKDIVDKTLNSTRLPRTSSPKDISSIVQKVRSIRKKKYDKTRCS
jgi:hypothetical protein